MVAIVVGAVLVLRGGNPGPSVVAPVGDASNDPLANTPQSTAQQYLQDFDADDTGSAGTLTDDPQTASAALLAAWQGLRPTQLQTTLGAVTTTGDTATAAYTATWTFNGGQVWTYDGTFGILRSGQTWRVHWTPAVLQPTLQAGQRLALVTTAPPQPVVLDRDGKPLVLAGGGGTHLADPNDFALLRSALISRLNVTSSNVFAVERVDAAGHDLQTLFGTTGGQMATQRSTLSIAVQSAAESVVNGYQGKAVIVAIQASDGGLLAVAQNPASAQGGSSPFSGLYAPGSTFKIVTATATLEAGTANIDSPLPCPLTAQIGTRTISNEGFDLGTVPMHEAFARSCNTTFGRLAFELPPNRLASAANQYGLNANFDIPGQSTQTGAVGLPKNSDEQVEDGIGQGTVQVSPFGEAVMAATVAAGHAVTPRLWLDDDTTVNVGYAAPSAAVLAALRTMMREVVTAGTAKGLAQSGAVYGKTGTAQFGSGDEAHGWFVGYRGDIAFVVFLEGANDSRPAVTLAAQFLAKVGQ
jgi:beta-lactamase class D